LTDAAFYSDQPPPFLGVAWAGGTALARYLLDHPDQVAGRPVLDLAAGSGIVAIAAIKAGATSARPSRSTGHVRAHAHLPAPRRPDDADVLVGDPGRAYFPTDYFTALTTDDVPVPPSLESVSVRAVTIYRDHPVTDHRRRPVPAEPTRSTVDRARVIVGGTTHKIS
jgi:predicted nicotinamide N-methyase